jgi:hypothetical protein
MTSKTIEDLQTLRSELVERRRQDVYRISGAQDDDRIGKAVQVHLAIEVIAAVIAEGHGEQEFEPQLGEDDFSV